MTQIAISNNTRLDLLPNVILKNMTLTTKRPFTLSKKKDSLRIIMALVAHYDLKFHSNGCENYLSKNGNLDEEVFIDQPERFMVEGKKNMVCKLKRLIYGLKQASKQWYLKCN